MLRVAGTANYPSQSVPRARGDTPACAAAAAGALGGLLLPGIDPLAGALLGLAVGVLVATLHALFDQLPSLERRWPSLAAVTLPVTVTGILVYVVGRVLVG